MKGVASQIDISYMFSSGDGHGGDVHGSGSGDGHGDDGQGHGSGDGHGAMVMEDTCAMIMEAAAVMDTWLGKNGFLA